MTHPLSMCGTRNHRNWNIFFEKKKGGGGGVDYKPRLIGSQLTAMVWITLVPWPGQKNQTKTWSEFQNRNHQYFFKKIEELYMEQHFGFRLRVELELESRQFFFFLFFLF